MPLPSLSLSFVPSPFSNSLSLLVVRVIGMHIHDKAASCCRLQSRVRFSQPLDAIACVRHTENDDTDTNDDDDDVV